MYLWTFPLIYLFSVCIQHNNSNKLRKGKNIKILNVRYQFVILIHPIKTSRYTTGEKVQKPFQCKTLIRRLYTNKITEHIYANSYKVSLIFEM
jgi:hypothetical protein